MSPANRLFVDVSHALGQKEAKKRIAGSFSGLKSQFGSLISEIREDWVGFTGIVNLKLNSLFPFMNAVSIRAVIKISATEVTVASDNLPAIVVPYTAQVEQKVRDYLQALLATE